MSLWVGLLIGLALGVGIALPACRASIRRQTTRARDAERRAQTAERLAETGAMTGGLAHEIKNPLSTIGLNAQLLGEAIDDAPLEDAERQRLRRRVDSIRREAERLRDTLQDFLTYAGGVHLELATVDLNQTVEELSDFFLPQAEHHGVRLRTELSPTPLRVRIDTGAVKQALLNLLLNATQAMDGSERPGELILRTEVIEPRRRNGAGHARAARVHVIDTGPGVPPERLGEIFKPYFTSKAGGTGLGLPTARRLIEAHAGTIEVVSTPGKGTDFVVTLPMNDAP